MTIQWFPGHMAKARREVSEKLKFVDIVFELIDARLPLSSRNPMLDQIVQQKPRLILLNKADLADPAQTTLWVNYFREQGHHVLALTAKNDKSVKQIVPASKKVLAEKMVKITCDSGDGAWHSECWKINIAKSFSRKKNR